MPTNTPSDEPIAAPETPSAIAKPQWLVSVRSLAEAELAVRCDVDILDLKEPRRGPLAPVSAQVWRQVADHVAMLPAARLSAALGESCEATELADQVPPRFAFAKAGPSGCDRDSQLRRLWDRVRGRLPGQVELVAVAYADHRAARCVEAERIVALAAASGFRRVLLDTFEKNGRSAIDVLGPTRLSRLGRLAHQQRLWWSLAGSITLGDVQRLGELIRDRDDRPDCYAVRGGVCGGGRTGTLCEAKMRQWQRALRSN
ncbi:(5-formylfuran-3-yl)methyl phosphate synthase [Rhodopirellula sp. JC639]|uniref:(5-formylfuran-3-yl)methyl phosphate synthase n=1 Tax=Stieleria mannarensis TaxID=2755585 RepID=UPI001603624E|nr:(5-formylfuran-3-yl)methyl phosphate synthase [Rhodopirellula sp. JC639]